MNLWVIVFLIDKLSILEKLIEVQLRMYIFNYVRYSML